MKTALLVGAIMIGGVGVGFAAERAGLVSPVSESVIIATLDPVPYYECPGARDLGDLHRGDRVFVTGRDGEGDWVEIRAPYDVGQRVWVEAAWLTPDSDLQAVPGVDCELSDVDAAGEPIGTTTTSSSSTSTSTSTSTSSSTSTSTSTSSSTTTSTTSSTSPSGDSSIPRDQQGPVLSGLAPSVSDIWEDGVYCGAQDQVLGVFVSVTDPSGVGSVQLQWSVGSASGTVGMVVYADPFYAATIGPLGDGTISGGPASISVTVTASDALANSSSLSSASLALLHDCVNG